jgi:hypothetical protein
MQFILHVSILCEFFKYNYRETVIMVYLVFKYAVYICIIIIILLLPGQKFISTLLSDILTILGIIWACKVCLDCFYNQIEKKQPLSRVEKR